MLDKLKKSGSDMLDMMKRPGGKLANRPLHFIWMVDCSGSMEMDGKMDALNYAIKESIPDVRAAANENPGAELLVRVVTFSVGAKWHTSATPIDEFEWKDLRADGYTDMGKAFELVADQLKMPPMSDRALPPVLVLVTDGQPTDEYKSALDKLHKLPWGTKAVKIAIAIGEDANKSMLEEFTRNKETVLHAGNPQALARFIKWASTLVKQVSAPVTNLNDDKPTNIDTNTIPTVAEGSINDSDVW